MILLSLVSLAVVAVILFLMRRINLGIRLVLALCVLVIFNLPTIVMLVVGDRPPDGARLVTREEFASPD